MVTFDLALWWFIPHANSHSTAAAGRLDVSILRALNWHPQGLPAPEHWPSASVELPDRKTWERKTTAGEKEESVWSLDAGEVSKCARRRERARKAADPAAPSIQRDFQSDRGQTGDKLHGRATGRPGAPRGLLRQPRHAPVCHRHHPRPWHFWSSINLNSIFSTTLLWSPLHFPRSVAAVCGGHSITPRSGIRISICLVQSHPGCCSHSCQQPVLSSYTPSPTCKVNAPNFY